MSDEQAERGFAGRPASRRPSAQRPSVTRRVHTDRSGVTRPASPATGARPASAPAMPGPRVPPPPRPEEQTTDFGGSLVQHPSPRPAGRKPWQPRSWFWPWVAAALALAILVGGASAYAVSAGTPTFSSTAALEIDQPGAVAASTDVGVLDKLDQLRLTYAGLVGTQLFAAPVAARLRLPLSEVSADAYAVAPGNSLLLLVGARTDVARQAQLLAAAMAQQVVGYTAREQTANGIPAGERVTFTLVTPAGPGVQISPTGSRIALVGVFAALLTLAAGIGVAQLVRVRPRR